jgi:hypothetical protein
MKSLALAIVLVVACTRPSEQRAEAELSIGTASLTDVEVSVRGGLAAIYELVDYRLELWAGAPDITITLVAGSTAGGMWTITVRNVMNNAVLRYNGGVFQRDPDQHPTVAIFHVALQPGTHELRVGPVDADVIEPFRVVAMADIQQALPVVDEMFEMISAVPQASFVVAMGDITEQSLIEEYDLFDRQLVSLTIPFYTTLGNHELWADFSRYHERYGRGSFQMQYKGVAFTFADSGDGGIDPLVETWLDGWFATARDQLHVFLTHMPPIDPVGTRYGGFRSAEDGRRLLARLVEADVDLTLYGHIHTYIQYENAGIPAYISGGGGALPMRWDGIDRHFLIVDLHAGIDSFGVALQRVD